MSGVFGAFWEGPLSCFLLVGSSKIVASVDLEKEDGGHFDLSSFFFLRP